MTISFIIPAFNTQNDKLIRCIRSVDAIKNSSFETELIIVDDGSDKDTADLCDKLSESFSNIRCIHKANGGVSSARNAGINKAKGDYVYFVDSDDSLIGESFDNLVINAEDIIYTDYVISNSDDGEGRYIRLFKTGGKKSVGHVIARMSVNGDVNNIWGKFIKTSFIREKGLSFNESIITAEDAKFLLDLLRNNPKISYRPISTYKYDYDVKTNDSRLANSTEQFLNNELGFLSELKRASGQLIKDVEKKKRIAKNCDERAVKMLFNSTTTLLKEHLFDSQRKNIILNALNSIDTTYKNEWRSKYKTEYTILIFRRWSVVRLIGSLRYAYLRIKDKPIRIKDQGV